MLRDVLLDRVLTKVCVKVCLHFPDACFVDLKQPLWLQVPANHSQLVLTPYKKLSHWILLDLRYCSFWWKGI